MPTPTAPDAGVWCLEEAAERAEPGPAPGAGRPTFEAPMSGHTTRGRLLAALVTLLTLVGLTACANREQPAGQTATTPTPIGADRFPVEVAVAGGKPVTLERRPERVVSLSPTATEMLFAVGAGKQVVAVDSLSNHPAEAPRTDLSAYTPNVEAVVGHRPDLVVAAEDRNDLVAGLTRVEVPVLLLPAATALEGTYEQIEALGKATGHRTEATDLTRRMRSDIDKIVRDTPRPGRELSYYHELDPQLYSATSKTFIGQVYGLFGLRNIADSADPTGSGYPKLSAEHVVNANPDLIFLADDESRETLASRPGWQSINAVKQNAVVTLEADTSSRWGPRIIDLVRQVSDAVSKAAG
ncbi:ABC transporter substrate-binding protein [Longimycelium tulufanense]|uniref:ABC transporter substrate-binding protein n=1 Tax=Longimycelium tulufanense TaxID=907463 RepID=A0A8J3CA40_9PSEU|nr:ABC transporter substrate-binding protein [Longimycelium tulufanense]GGM37109.1 ABC transporter substrate-binding protein [Longimycelium tulufanense]